MNVARPDTRPAWPYVTTTGVPGHFSLKKPRIDQVSADWLAISLSRAARWNGHTDPALPPYSVAQHCVWCAEFVYEQTRDPLLGLSVLLHDAHEAVIGDIPTPVKARLTELGLKNRMFKCFVCAVDQAIYGAFGLAFPLGNRAAGWVRVADMTALVTEWRDLITDPKPALLPDPAALNDLPPPHPAQIEPWKSAATAASIWISSAQAYVAEAQLEAPALEAMRVHT